MFLVCDWSIAHLKYRSVSKNRCEKWIHLKQFIKMIEFEEKFDLPVQSSKLIGATDGQMTPWLGSYIGFKSDFITSGRFKYDHKLVVLLCNLITCRSRSESQRNVPYELKKLCSNNSISMWVLNSKLNGNWQCNW